MLKPESSLQRRMQYKMQLTWRIPMTSLSLEEPLLTSRGMDNKNVVLQVEKAPKGTLQADWPMVPTGTNARSHWRPFLEE